MYLALWHLLHLDCNVHWYWECLFKCLFKHRCKVQTEMKQCPFIHQIFKRRWNRPYRNSYWGFFFAHMVMSLCNYALSIMCHCHQPHQCYHHWHLCTAVLVTTLIKETSYLADICTYCPSLCTWNIRPMWQFFFGMAAILTSFFCYVPLLI